MSDFSHIDGLGSVRMVDVSDKDATKRTAVASGRVVMSFDTLEKIISGTATKGNVIETARIAGVMGAKQTANLIPMCHPLNITHAKIDFEADKENSSVIIKAEVSLNGTTGVEMEALMAVSTAALTIYDMCKAYDKSMEIQDIVLEEKLGGKSGHFKRE